MSGPWQGLESGVVALGHLAQIQLGKMLQPISSDEADMEVPYLNAGLLGAAFSESAKKTMFANATEVKPCAVVEGDLLVADWVAIGQDELANPDIDPGSMVSESIDHQVGARRRADRLIDWLLD